MSDPPARSRTDQPRESDRPRWDEIAPDDRFIPISATDLTRLILSDHAEFGPVRDGLADVAYELRHVLDLEAAALERRLTELYQPFNPDRDTIPLPRDGPPPSIAAFEADLASLLERANFERLDTSRLSQAVHAAEAGGLRVRVRHEEVERSGVWVRGRAMTTRRFRTWRHPLRGIVQNVEVYRRLCVFALMKHGRPPVLKMFREIPIVDIEALLPHAEVRMTWLDRLRAFGGAGGALGATAMKLSQVALAVAHLTQILWVLLVGSIVLFVRGFFGYRHARLRRTSQRTHNLYYQNIANNAGVIHTLVSMVCQEEFKEALLAYATCRDPARAIDSPAALGRHADRYLHERLGVRAKFDSPDACRILHRLGLWSDAGAFTPLPPDAAAAHLAARAASVRPIADGPAPGVPFSEANETHQSRASGRSA